MTCHLPFYKANTNCHPSRNWLKESKQSMVTREAGKPVNIVTLEPDRLDVCGPNWKPQTEWGKVWENVRYLVSQLDMRWTTPPRCPSGRAPAISSLIGSSPRALWCMSGTDHTLPPVHPPSPSSPGAPTPSQHFTVPAAGISPPVHSGWLWITSQDGQTNFTTHWGDVSRELPWVCGGCSGLVMRLSQLFIWRQHRLPQRSGQLPGLGIRSSSPTAGCLTLHFQNILWGEAAHSRGVG